MRTIIGFVSFRRIQQAGPEGYLMTRLAVALNDFCSGNNLLGMAKMVMDEPRTKDQGQGMAMFAIKVQIGHLAEALRLIRNRHDPDLQLKQRRASRRTLLPYHVIARVT